jgi:hypothetical protein
MRIISRRKADNSRTGRWNLHVGLFAVHSIHGDKENKASGNFIFKKTMQSGLTSGAW